MGGRRASAIEIEVGLTFGLHTSCGAHEDVGITIFSAVTVAWEVIGAVIGAVIGELMEGTETAVLGGDDELSLSEGVR